MYVCMCVCVYGGDLVVKSCPINATLWTVACQAPLSMAFPRQEYWSGLPFPSAGDLPDPGIKLRSPTWQTGLLHCREFSVITEPPGKMCVCVRERESVCVV